MYQFRTERSTLRVRCHRGSRSPFERGGRPPGSTSSGSTSPPSPSSMTECRTLAWHRWHGGGAWEARRAVRGYGHRAGRARQCRRAGIARAARLHRTARLGNRAGHLPCRARQGLASRAGLEARLGSGGLVAAVTPDCRGSSSRSPQRCTASCRRSCTRGDPRGSRRSSPGHHCPGRRGWGPRRRSGTARS